MTLGAFFILEANLYLPKGKHMVSMAEATLGNLGILTSWLSYLFLLYSLLSAYISGGADVLSSLFLKTGIHLQDWQASSLFTLFFGLIVYGGIHSVDYANRFLMFGKLAVYCCLVVLISPHIDVHLFEKGSMIAISSSVMILITSFGYAIIIPNLRDYFDDDIKTLKKVILVGSLIPLLCYLAWDAVIMGTLPSGGNQGLHSLMNNPHTTSMLAAQLSNKVNNTTISVLFSFFTSICMLTAFLGVSLCLFSFLADGLKLSNTRNNNIGLFFLTFTPPLLIVLFYPGAYIHALSYAGVFCIILLLLLPALMCYKGRQKYRPSFKVPGGKATQYLVIAVSIILLTHEFWRLV
jgi:tyrosine-specific transport protein